jgi:hypothetical protein
LIGGAAAARDQHQSEAANLDHQRLPGDDAQPVQHIGGHDRPRPLLWLSAGWDHEVVSTPEQFFTGSPVGLALYTAVADAISAIGPAEVKVTKSQIAFRRRKGFAFVWRPDQYVSTDVPVVLSFGLPRDLHSPRVKEVVHPAPKVWMHHIELRDRTQVDPEVRGWLAAAYENAR